MIKCNEFKKLVSKDIIFKKAIKGRKYYALKTRKKDKEGKYIDLILRNCPICGRKVYPHAEKIRGW